MPTITKRRLDAAIAAGGGESVLWDSELPGFGVRLKPSSRTFLVQFRNRAGRSRRHSFARYGVMTCDEARREARQLLAEVARGVDIAEARRAGRAAPTVKDLCVDYVAAMEAGDVLTRFGTRKKLSTIATDKGRIERHIVPLLGHRLVSEVGPADIERFRRDVRGGKTAADVKTGPRGRAIVKGGSGTATRTQGLLGGIFSWARANGWRKDNPVTGVAREGDGVRKVALDERQYKALGTILKTGDRTWQASAGIILIAISGTRRSEIVTLPRDAVHARSQALSLADSKSGPSVRPVGGAVIAFIDALAPLSRDGLVLPSARIGTGPYGGLPGAWNRIRAATPSLAGVTLRDLRRSHSSVADELDLSIPTIAALLGHAGSSITERYIVKPDPLLQAAADKVANEVLRRMGLSVGDLVGITRLSARENERRSEGGKAASQRTSSTPTVLPAVGACSSMKTRSSSS